MPDPMSLLLAGMVLAAAGIAALGSRRPFEGMAVVLLRTALAVAAVLTRDLLWSISAIALLPFVGFVEGAGGGGERKWGAAIPSFVALTSMAAVGFMAKGTDLALVAASEAPASGVLELLALALGAVWLLESRRLIGGSPSGAASRVAASFALQLAVASVLLKMTAWLPDSAPTASIEAMSLAALAFGALGALGATRIATFLTGAALARGGLLLLATLGGVHGRAPFALVAAGGGVALLLLALSTEELAVLDDARRLDSFSSRFPLLVGAFTASCLPPFPGFVALFPLASAVLLQGRGRTLIAAAIFLFLLAVGAMRLVARALEERSSPPAGGSARSPRRLVASGLAFAAIGGLLIAPNGAIELATRAALEML